MADIFDVIADPTRRELLKLLHEGHGSVRETVGTAHGSAAELSVKEVVASIGLSQPTVSKHLKVLRDHGLVTVREEGQHRYYRLEGAPLETVADWLLLLKSTQLDPSDVTALTGWAGADVGTSFGATVAEGTHRARAV
ncbi:MAG: metalloregulator ArsR/SmtB family transcription factor, partial [Salinibacterium sp.]|nr:metalloregulator ArsR/SmtB family transcription factor [Salinibacterium sp.]